MSSQPLPLAPLFEPPPPAAVERAALLPLLQKVFGHGAFRPAQEDVCAAVASGKDVLLVMPTGAGKSLCYQLPGLARGGVTLVISPLLSLIEDQVSKLHQLGIAAERIHSGLSREEAREVCRRYLRGELSFLFIAPERLAVPGFPEMLAKRALSLIAIDEAHCISQWGHDFRPEYRMLGARLPLFRPAPVVALTATATPEVQDDIVAQLGIGAERHVYGFRRDNLVIEAMNLEPSRRGEAIAMLLSDDTRRPAIVYAPSRKATEALAQDLVRRGKKSGFSHTPGDTKGIRAAAYHAGLSKPERERVQTAFAQGDLDVVVATVAFGMGIDKANVRAVVHAGLPASVEGYYQEIGRAGRDGAPSHAVLFFSYADKRTHEFLLGRSYPELADLDTVRRALERGPLDRDTLRARVSLEDEIFERAVEQLWVHGGLTFGDGDEGDEVKAGTTDYRRTYASQRASRFAQLAAMVRYAEGSTCRMQALVGHFGDNPGERCGRCDGCDDRVCIARSFREPSAAEHDLAARIRETLREKSRSIGQLLSTLAEAGFERESVMHMVDALARAGAITARESSFERDGERISYTRLSLVADVDAEGAPLSVSDRSKRTRERTRRTRGVREGHGGEGETTRVSRAALESDPVHAALREWRRELAKEHKIPAFRILSDRVLASIVFARPRNLDSLLACNGVGPHTADKYGREILRVMASAQEAAAGE